MSEHRQRIESLFHAAQAITEPGQREAFLTAECGTDQGLREEVQALLVAADKAGSFLNQPALAPDATLAFSQPAQDRAAVLEAGLSGAFEQNQVVVVGRAGSSILKSLGRMLNVTPRVNLREESEASAPPHQPPSPEAPSRDSESRYQVHGEIARGGMGAILKGRDTDLGRELAIKVLLESHRDNPEVVQRFIEEAQIGGQLQHPGIAPVYELGQFADRRPYFSMKLVKGETLARLLAGRPDPSADRSRFIGIFEQICQTMAYAHSRGVLHRDLKPANIMVGAFGEVQVMDWGLAKVLTTAGGMQPREATSSPGTSVIHTRRNQVGSKPPSGIDSGCGSGSETRAGSVMGTPAYMPPEQALGEVDSLDERADVFGLGAILCEILTGLPPYVAEHGGAVLRLAARGRLTDCLARLDACGADAELVAIARHCLALEPADRPRDAGVLAERVSQYLRSVETRLRAAEVAHAAEAARAAEALHTVAHAEARARAERRARRLQLTMATVVLGLVSVGAVAATYLAILQSQLKDAAVTAEQRALTAQQQAISAARREQQLAQEAQDLQLRESQLRQQAEVRELTMQSHLYAAEMNLAAQASADPSGLRRVRQITANWSPAAVSRDLRGWEWQYLESLQHLDRLTIESTRIRCLSWHPAGTHFATGGQDGRVQVWEASGRLAYEQPGHTGIVRQVSWSRDGERMASSSEDKTVRIWHAATREPCAPMQRYSHAVESFSWSPDGQQMAVKSGPQLIVCQVATGEPVRRFDTLDREANVDWHPTRPLLASVHAVWDVTSGEQVFRHPATAVIWSPDGTRLGGTSYRTAYVFSGEDGRILHELMGHADGIEALAWSPSGHELLTAGRDDTARIWNVQTGQLQTVLRGHAEWVIHAAWRPDGRQIATASLGAIKLWNWPLRTNPAVVQGGRTAPGSIAWNSDGTRVAAVGERFVTWNRDSLAREQQFPLDGLNVESQFSPRISWSSLGRLIALRRQDSLVLLDDQTGAVKSEIRMAPEKTRSVCLSPDGSRLATSVYAQSAQGDAGLLRVYDTASGQEVWSDTQPGNTAGSLAWSLDGRQLAVGGWVSVLVYDALRGELQARHEWDHSLGWILDLEWNSAGDRLVMALFDHSVRVVDARDGRQLQKLVGHTSEVRGVSWSPDGRRIASCGRDQTVRIWDPVLGRQMMMLEGPTALVTAVAWSPDSRSLASISVDGEVHLWDSQVDPTRQVISLADRPPDPSPAVGPSSRDDLPLSPEDIQRELDRLARDIAADPAAIALLHNRGVFLASLGRWQESAADYARIVQLVPARRMHWGITASALLMAGDHEAYQRHCQAMVEQFRDSTEADVADTVCKTALLMPGTVSLADLPITTLQKATQDPQWEHFRAWFVACAALIAYRSGEFEEALTWVGKSPGLNGPPGALTLCVQALAEEALGRSDAARETLRKAEQMIPAALKTLGTAEYTGPLPARHDAANHDWIVAELLRREATLRSQSGMKAEPSPP